MNNKSEPSTSAGKEPAASFQGDVIQRGVDAATENLSDIPSNQNSDDNLFKPITGDASGNEAIEVESLCVNCGENGVTKLLLTIIPFYKEVILSSFSCPHCSHSNNEIQSAGQIESLGVQCSIVIQTAQDLDRKVIKSDAASVKIPELQFEIPSGSQKGEITTVEGVLQRAIEGLVQDQPARQEKYPEEYKKIQDFIGKLEECLALQQKFTLILRDISGHSFICPPSNYVPGKSDVQVKVDHFIRTLQEDHQLGIYPELDSSPNPPPIITGASDPDDFSNEVQVFQTQCSNCLAESQTKMKLVNVPYFKEVIVMATDCDECGHKTNEVKTGGGIEEKGKKITLTVENVDDLSRDVLKTHTCSVHIPLLELEVGAGTVGGKFTTLEGLLTDIKEQITSSYAKFLGDSEPDMKQKLEDFTTNFEKCLALDHPFVVVFDDPTGNSYVQNIQAPYDDPQLETESYERTFEQNEELGLNDINTENYQQDAHTTANSEL